MSEFKMSLPFIAHIPYQVQICDDLTDACKIYFGQIVPFAGKSGYMWATDDQLAEMKGVSKRTIERWNNELEEAGFIRRETQNVPSKQKDGSFGWTKKRRIYFNDAFSVTPVVPKKKKSVDPKPSPDIQPDIQPDKPVSFSDFLPPENDGIDTAKNGGTIDTAIFGGTIDTAKNGGISISSLPDNIYQQPKEPVVVIFSSLNKLDIKDTLRMKISDEYKQEEVDKAVERCLKWKSRPSDDVGIMTALSRADTWMDNASAEDQQESNAKWLRQFDWLDGKQISNTNVRVGNKYIEFSSGMKIIVYSIDQDSFKQKVKDYMEYLKRLSEKS